MVSEQYDDREYIEIWIPENKEQIKNKFTMIPHSIIKHLFPKLKLGEKTILIILWDYTYGYNKQWQAISIPKLTKIANCCESTTKRSIKSLIEKDLIIKHQHKSRNNKHKYNVYKIKGGRLRITK